MGGEWNGHAFLGIYLPNNQKCVFQKLMPSPICILTSILFHSQCINYLNQLLEEINDWARKTKWVVDIFMGSPIDIWIYPIISRV